MNKNRRYRAIVSSDWNECLAPTGPFDAISFNHLELASDLAAIFQDCTDNTITLEEAIRKIQELLPDPLSVGQMDAYLDQSFIAYRGVYRLIEWCSDNSILFMINTTGMTGFFQRVLAKGLLPSVPALSAHPMIRYPHMETDPYIMHDLLRLQDKAKNTQAVMHSLDIPPGKVFVIGDSGGDGPHFKWGMENGAFLIGSMTKSSLTKYCRNNNIHINLQFGLSYLKGEKRNQEKEMLVDFMELSSIIDDILKQPSH